MATPLPARLKGRTMSSEQWADEQVIGPESTWDGILDPAVYSEWVVEARTKLADAAHRYDWDTVLAVLEEHPQFVNSWRPGGSSWFAPLHQAAHGGAPVDVVEELISRGAWRLLRAQNGELPLDVARRKERRHLYGILEAELKHDVAADVVAAIQDRFHEVILGRVRVIEDLPSLRLPEVEVLLEFPHGHGIWFPVPGMYGGFTYRLAADRAVAKLVTESWCRVAGGSGQRHEITPSRADLVTEGFV